MKIPGRPVMMTSPAHVVSARISHFKQHLAFMTNYLVAKFFRFFTLCLGASGLKDQKIFS